MLVVWITSLFNHLKEATILITPCTVGTLIKICSKDQIAQHDKIKTQKTLEILRKIKCDQLSCRKLKRFCLVSQLILVRIESHLRVSDTRKFLPLGSLTDSKTISLFFKFPQNGQSFRYLTLFAQKVKCWGFCRAIRGNRVRRANTSCRSAFPAPLDRFL